MTREMAGVVMTAVIGILVAAPSGRAAEPSVERPVRVAVRPAYHEGSADESPECKAEVLPFFLRERLEACPAVCLMSGGRAGALFGELTGGAREVSTNLAEGFSRFVPVDAVISAGVEGKAAILVIDVADGRRRMPAGPAAETLQGFFLRAGGFVADTLRLPPADKAALTEVWIEDPEAFRLYYATPLISVPWPRNSGEARLKMLRPAWTRLGGNRHLCERVLADAAMQVQGGRRDQSFNESALQMARMSLASVLGTPSQAAAERMLAASPVSFAKDILDVAKPLASDEVDAALEGLLDNEAGTAVDELRPGVKAGDSAWWTGKFTDEMRRGALELAGYLRTPQAVELIVKCAAHKSADTRLAAAVALGRLDGESGLPQLKELMRDQDARVAFTAAWGLWKRDKDAAELPALAAAVLDGPAAPVRRRAEEALAATATAAQADALARLAKAPDGESRAAALRGLLRAGLVQPDAMKPLLEHVDEAVVRAAAGAAGRQGAAAGLSADLIRLANEPYAPVAESARTVLAGIRPAEPAAAAVFDLAVEHPYLRLRILDRLAASGQPADANQLFAACANPDPHTRAYALELAAKKDPARARPAVVAALGDDHRWVRLQAAALVPSLATPADAVALKAARERERETAVRLYIDDALAAIGAGPAPEPRPAARSVKGPKTLSWVTGMGLDAERSPFEAYYCLSMPNMDVWKKASAAGKIVFVRISPIGHPGTIVVDAQARDRFWRAIDAAVPGEAVPLLDGLVFGEETMSMDSGALWDEGWRLFCVDAGIDPARVKGDLKALSAAEQGAFHWWARERSVDGFNLMVDYVHRKLGRLRPGIQVCTFLPGESASPGADPKRWKFDVGGIYDYKGDNRLAGYSLIRRMKTLWPDRPVLWLSLGIGGYEMNPVKRTQSVPAGPLFTRGIRCYTDATAAWIAGADTGWFSTWIFVEPNFSGSMADLRGVQVLVEDLAPDSPMLAAAIDYAFRGAESDLLQPALPKGAGEFSIEKGLEAGAADEDLLDVLDEDDREGQAKQAVADDRERFRRGFVFYRNYVYDCARLFSSLPRGRARPEAIVVRPGVTVWTRPETANPLIPAEALLNAFDFLDNVNHLPTLDLARYRLIVLHDPGALEDATLAAVTAWLKTTPGVLVVHGAVAADNGAEAPTLADHDGKLANDWPWEGSVAIRREAAPGKLADLGLTDPPGGSVAAQGIVASTFELKDARAKALFAAGDRVLAAVWRDPAYKGAVVFDGVESASQPYVIALREALNRLWRDSGAGLEIAGPAVQEILSQDGVTAAASPAYYRGVGEHASYKGLDVLTGHPEPRVGRAASAAVVSESYTNRYVAAVPGLVALAERPFEALAAIDGGLELGSPGLVRVSAGTRPVTVKGEADLPAVTNDVPGWIALGQGEGVATMATGTNGESAVYIRSGRPVRVTVAQ